MLKPPHNEKGAYRKKAFRLVEIIFLTFACFFVVNLVKLQNCVQYVIDRLPFVSNVSQ